MARLKLNKYIESASGSAGKNISFKQVGSVTLFATKPERTGNSTEKQRLQRERFKRAAAYAKASLLDPATKAAYAKSVEGIEFQNAFTAAVADYLNSPKVDNVDHSDYSGKVGETIIVKVFDAFKVADVRVTISLANNTVVETSLATQVVGSSDWKYVTTKANATLAGSKITVVVKDKPGNSTTFEKTL
jgi:hypothetical protein